MTLIQKIKDFLKLKKNHDVTLQEIYHHFKQEKQSTIRGRLNEYVSVPREIIRTGKGRYMLVGAEVSAIIETSDVNESLNRIIEADIKYDLIFLDIPYNLAGQKGGNRNLANYNLIEPSEFNEILPKIESLLKDQNSQLYFMIASGKSSIKKANEYINCFNNTGLNLAAQGSYIKTFSNGNICNMGKHEMPPELIQVYSRSGNLFKPSKTKLDFKLVRPPLPKQGGYPTQKPLKMMKQIIRQATNIRGLVLDLFGGSGVTLEASIKLSRKCHIFDISENSVENFILKKIQ